MKLSKEQSALIRRKLSGKVFLEGSAGTGKTTTAVRRVLHMIEKDIPASSILLLVPQKSLALPYHRALRDPALKAGGRVSIATVGSLALQMVDLFWPLVVESAGFKQTGRRPTFLSLEMAQYFMSRLIGPVIEKEGLFEGVSITRSRIYSQILDNLNKAAVVGFPHTAIGERLKASWMGDIAQKHVYEDAQRCATLFRKLCMEHNFLDFSLQVQIFIEQLWHMDAPRSYLLQQYQHLIVDNVEEDNPAMHDVLVDWMAHVQSALLIYDTEAGYRRFLGADPQTGFMLRDVCDEQIVFSHSFVTTPDLISLGNHLTRSLNRPIHAESSGDPRNAIVYGDHRYYTQMIDWTASEIASLVHRRGVPPDEIAVLSPFLSDALRFSLSSRLEEHQVPVRSHRPSRSLREEAAARCLLTLAQLAHPQWEMPPNLFELAYALMQSLDELDLARAQLLAGRVRDGSLLPFQEITTAMQERITYAMGEKYEHLRTWIEQYQNTPTAEIDVFFSRLFGEVLSQKDFGFHADFDAARTAANLIDSARNFRQTLENNPPKRPIGHEYIDMVNQGVLADQYIRSWETTEEPAVLLAPAYTFLMRNQPVDYQFWLNIGSGGWWERLYQPLTHPYVLSRDWTQGQLWTDADEFGIRQDALARLIVGLVRRCRKNIYLGYSQLGEQGYEQRGPLLESLQKMLRRLNTEENRV